MKAMRHVVLLYLIILVPHSHGLVENKISLIALFSSSYHHTRHPHPDPQSGCLFWCLAEVLSTSLIVLASVEVL